MQTFVNQPPLYLAREKFGVSLTDLTNEPSLIACSEDFVLENGGNLVKQALSYLMDIQARDRYNAIQAGLTPVIDVRVQRLNLHTYPIIPGWHCDGVPRSINSGEYNMSAIHPRAFHVALTLSSEHAGVSNTEYVNAAVRAKMNQADSYRDVHSQIERAQPSIRRANDGEFIKYFPKTLHRATETHRAGIRFYMRYSMCERPTIVNNIPNTQQVYLVNSNGW